MMKWERGNPGSENLNEVEDEVGLDVGCAPSCGRRWFGPEGAQTNFSWLALQKALAARFLLEFLFSKPALNKPRDCCFSQRRRGWRRTFH
jgi:hypothetical protein